MRGYGESNGSLWCSLDLEELVERDHPLRAIKRMVDDALRGMDADFRRAYSRNAGYWRSQRRRKIVEEFFGWSKTVGGLRRSRHPEMRSAGGRSRSRWS